MPHTAQQLAALLHTSIGCPPHVVACRMVVCLLHVLFCVSLPAPLLAALLLSMSRQLGTFAWE